MINKEEERIINLSIVEGVKERITIMIRKREGGEGGEDDDEEK